MIVSFILACNFDVVARNVYGNVCRVTVLTLKNIVVITQEPPFSIQSLRCMHVTSWK